MADRAPDLRREIEALLEETDISAVNLRRAFEDLAVKHPRDFRQHADLWAVALFQRDPEFFGDFVTSQLGESERDIIQALLAHIEAQGPERLFTPLYEKIHNEATWNQELVELAQSSLPDEIVNPAVKLRAAPGMLWRNPRWSISDEAATALYRRSPIELLTFVKSHLAKTKEGHRFDLLGEEAKRHGDMDLYWYVFRFSANAEEWRQALEELLTQDVAPEKIGIELARRQPEREVHAQEKPAASTPSQTAASADTHIWQALLDKYGKGVDTYLLKYVPWYFRRQLEELLTSDLAAVALMRELEVLARMNWKYFGDMADIWAPALYRRYPDISSTFLRQYLRQEEVIHALLPEMEAAGQESLFRHFYRQRGSRLWHTDVMTLAASDLSDAEVLRGLQRRRASHWTLNSTGALALYRRNRALFRPLIWAHITSGIADADRTLLEEIKQHGDMDLYWHVFRNIASSELWQKELERLVAEDIAPERIVSELEKRHVQRRPHIRPEIWLRLLQKYGSVLTPYLEQHMRSLSRRRLEALLALDINRGTLLHELDKVARENPNAFRDLADLWAPALYERSPEFFKTFLIRHLNRWANAPMIYKLLERAEADGHDALFRDLYRVIVRRDEWEQELLDLVRSSKGDEEVLRLILLRTEQWTSITSPEIAMALYYRNAALFTDFLRDHSAGAAAERLRDEAKKGGDWELYRHFQQIAPVPVRRDTDFKELLDPTMTLAEVVDELEPLRSRYRYEENAAFFEILFQLLERHGEPILPFMRGRVPANKKEQFLEAVEKIGNKALYWREFLSIRGSNGWNEAIRDLLAQPLDNDALLREIHFRTPAADPSAMRRWRSWSLDSDLAIEFYKRSPTHFRSFIEESIEKPTPELYTLAEARGDEEFLDFLTIDLLQEAMNLAQTARHQSWWNANVQAAEQRLKEIGEVVRARFDRLYATSPELYVRHAAMMLGRFRAFEIRRASTQLDANPVFSYLATRHHESWRRSPAAMRDLMESPNIFVQIIGLEILDADSIDAAERVIENLTILRALLLGRARPNTKQRVLRCLEHAARQGQRYADLILPLLEEAKDLHGSRSISELILVSYVRLKHAMDHPEMIAAGA